MATTFDQRLATLETATEHHSAADETSVQDLRALSDEELNRLHADTLKPADPVYAARLHAMNSRELVQEHYATLNLPIK